MLGSFMAATAYVRAVAVLLEHWMAHKKFLAPCNRGKNKYNGGKICMAIRPRARMEESEEIEEVTAKLQGTHSISCAPQKLMTKVGRIYSSCEPYAQRKLN